MIARGLLVLAVAALPSALDAQTRTPPSAAVRTRPAPAQPPIGVRGYVLFGSLALSASETFDAVAGGSRRAFAGGGAQVTNLWRNVFADVALSQASLDGERVFVDGGRVFELGIPLEITMRPLDIAGGWRMQLLRGRLSPYAGAGFTVLKYTERSDFAGADEDVDEGKAGPLVIAGADVRVWRWISAGGELRWRRVTGVLGEGGVSSELGENDAGGVAAAVRISIGR